MSASRLLCLIAVVIFALAAFGAKLGGFGELDLACLGLVFFAAGHVVP